MGRARSTLECTRPPPPCRTRPRARTRCHRRRVRPRHDHRPGRCAEERQTVYLRRRFVARGTGHADPVPRRGSKRHCRRPWLRARRRDVLSRVVPASGRAINGKRRAESSRRCDGPREHRFHLGFDRHAERRCRTAPLSPSSRCHLRRARLWLGRSRRTDAAILTSLRIHTCSPVLSRQQCKPGSVQRATRSERYCESIGRSHSARSIGAPGVPCRRLRGCSTRARPTKCDGGVIP
jgi:hypothetical protein